MTNWLPESALQGFGPGIDYAVYGLGVLIVLVFAVWLFRRLGGGTFIAGGIHRHRRLAVLDAAPIDTRRRLVLVRRDDREHLLLIGGATDIVVEQNIHRAEDDLAGKTGKSAVHAPDNRPEKAVAPLAEGGMAASPAARAEEKFAAGERSGSAELEISAAPTPAASDRSLAVPDEPGSEPVPLRAQGGAPGIGDENADQPARRSARATEATEAPVKAPCATPSERASAEPAARLQPDRPHSRRQEETTRKKSVEPQTLDDEMERLLQELSSGRG